MTPLTYRTNSEEETIALAAQLAREWAPNQIVLLIGNLGAGKTTFAKGVVEGLGIARREDVSSPTFPLIHEYGDPVRIYHIDLYRLDTAQQAEALGLRDILDSGAMVLLEWAERFPQLLPAQHIEIHLSTEDAESRSIAVNELR